MFAQALLNPIPKVLIDDRRMLAFMDLAFMGDAADIDRVRQEFVDVPPAEQAAAGRAACAIDANRNPQTLGVEGLFEADDASCTTLGAYAQMMGNSSVRRLTQNPRGRPGASRRAVGSFASAHFWPTSSATYSQLTRWSTTAFR